MTEWGSRVEIFWKESGVERSIIVHLPGVQWDTVETGVIETKAEVRP